MKNSIKTSPYDTTLYCYVQKANAVFARAQAKKETGSYSAYIDALISKARGVTPKLGKWKASDAIAPAKKATNLKAKPTTKGKPKPAPKRAARIAKKSAKIAKLTDASSLGIY